MPGRALTPPALGYFGKLSSRRSFVRTDLPRHFTDHWDAWFFRLSAGLC